MITLLRVTIDVHHKLGKFTEYSDYSIWYEVLFSVQQREACELKEYDWFDRREFDIRGWIEAELAVDAKDLT